MHRASGAHDSTNRNPSLSAAHSLPRSCGSGPALPRPQSLRVRKTCRSGTHWPVNRQKLSHACDWEKSPLQDHLTFITRQEKSSKLHVVKAAKAGTFSDDPWQEDSGRHEVLESMEEVGQQSRGQRRIAPKCSQ